jgi:hypothetical protein
MRDTAFLFTLVAPWAISVYQYTIHFAKRKVGREKKFCRKIAAKNPPILLDKREYLRV